MRDLVKDVRTAIKNHNGYVYIPDLRAYMKIELKTNPPTFTEHPFDTREIPSSASTPSIPSKPSTA